jgi:hypothetical protein
MASASNKLCHFDGEKVAKKVFGEMPDTHYIPESQKKSLFCPLKYLRVI